MNDMEIKIKGITCLVDEDVYNAIKTLGFTINPHSSGYINIYIGQKGNRPIEFFLHRLIMRVGEKKEVDHINSNRADNRRCNLRIASRSSNHANKGVRSGKKGSLYKGVHFHSKSRKWQASFGNSLKKERVVKYFNCEVVAAKWYEMKSIEKHGEFARVQPVPENHVCDDRCKYGPNYQSGLNRIVTEEQPFSLSQ